MFNKLFCSILFGLTILTVILNITDAVPALFWFLSPNPITEVIRVGIATTLLAIAYSSRTLRPPFRILVKTFSIFLGVFGVTSLFTNSMGWAFYNYVMPLDSILMIESGILFGLAILNTSTSPAKSLPKTSKPQTAKA